MDQNDSPLSNLWTALKMSLLIRWSAIPLAIHLLLWWLFYLLMIIRVEFFSYVAGEVSLAYWSWLWLAAFLTGFINFIVTFKKEFSYHLTMSVPRNAFGWYYLKIMVLYNILVTALIILDLNILRFLNHAFGFREIDFLSVVYSSQTNHPIFQILIVLAVLMFCSTLGAFVGSSTYRYGLPFVWIFWLTVGLGSAILLSVSEALAFFDDLINYLLWFLGAGPESSAIAGSGHFLILSAVLMLVTFLNIKRIELK